MKNKLYQQCRLQKGSDVIVTWIPSEFAKSNKVLKVKLEGIWDRGWTVDAIFDKKITGEELEVMSWQYRNTREVSDI